MKHDGCEAKTRMRRFLIDAGGAALAEFALSASVLILIFIAIVDFGIYMYERDQIAKYGQGLMLYITQHAPDIYYDRLTLASITSAVTPTTLGLTLPNVGAPTIAAGCGCASGGAISLSAFNNNPPKCNSGNVCNGVEPESAYVRASLTYNHRPFLLPAQFLPTITNQFIVKIN